MEALDDILWKEELICIRLNKAVKKKKEAKVLGTRIAAELTAHVAQTVGHTVLLYRPGIPATLDLDQLVASMKGNDDNDKDDDNEEKE
jgi:RNA-binding protein YhbY